ncbi:hypothetical protein [Parabacteroides goldsteinii]
MDAETIIITVALLAVIVVLAIALIAKESREEKAETSGDRAIKYLRDKCKYSAMILCKPGFYDEDNDISFAIKIESALSQGLSYKRELEYKISELDRLKNTQEKNLRKWCVEQSKGEFNMFAHADILYKNINGKLEKQ